MSVGGAVGSTVLTEGWARCRRCGKHPVVALWKFLRGANGLPREKDKKAKPQSRWRTMGYAHCACLTTDWMDVDLRLPDGTEGLRKVWEGVAESGVDAVEVAPDVNET